MNNIIRLDIAQRDRMMCRLRDLENHLADAYVSNLRGAESGAGRLRHVSLSKASESRRFAQQQHDKLAAFRVHFKQHTDAIERFDAEVAQAIETMHGNNYGTQENADASEWPKREGRYVIYEDGTIAVEVASTGGIAVEIPSWETAQELAEAALAASLDPSDPYNDKLLFDWAMYMEEFGGVLGVLDPALMGKYNNAIAGIETQYETAEGIRAAAQKGKTRAEVPDDFAGTTRTPADYLREACAGILGQPYAPQLLNNMKKIPPIPQESKEAMGLLP